MVFQYYLIQLHIDLPGNTTQKYPSAPFHIDPLKKGTSKSDNCGH